MKIFTKIWSFLKGREIPKDTRYVKVNGFTYGILPDGKVFVVLHGSTL